MPKSSSKTPWISVKDQLPDPDVLVLTWPDSPFMVRHLKQSGEWFFDSHPVIYWMPLPADPPPGLPGSLSSTPILVALDKADTEPFPFPKPSQNIEYLGMYFRFMGEMTSFRKLLRQAACPHNCDGGVITLSSSESIDILACEFCAHRKVLLEE